MKLPLKLFISIFLVIGIFSVSQNYIYGQNSQQQQEEGEKKVELLNHKVERNGENSGKFIGQVQNMLNKNVEYVTIIATFYDKDGKIIGSKATYTKPNIIKPNMIASFDMSLNNEISPNNISSYDVTIMWRFPGESERYSNVYG
jgi:hypothetical protein